MGFPEYEGPVHITQLRPGVMMVRPVSRNVSAGADGQSRCRKCARPFDPADPRFAGAAQRPGTPFCRECVDRCQDDRCHDTEIEDHWCMVDQWDRDKGAAPDAR